MKHFSKNYKFRLRQTLLLVLMIAGLSCPAQSQEPKVITSFEYESEKTREYPADIQKIIDRGKLIVGLAYEDKPPFFSTNEEGGLYGLDIDLAKGIAERFGVDVEFNRDAQTYEELHEMAAKGDKVDMVVAKFSMTFERAKRVRYSKPYITFRQAILVNKKLAAKEKIEDYPMDYLREAIKIKVGVRQKTSYVEYARELFENAEIVEGPWIEIIAKVVKGEITAVMRDEYEIMKVIRQNPDYAVDVSVYVLKDRKDHIAVAVPTASVNLLAWIDMYLDARSEVLTARDIIRRYPQAWNKKQKSIDNFDSGKSNVTEK